MRVKGDKALMAALEKLGNQAPAAVGRALHNRAESIITESKEQYVPVDTGALRASGTVLLPFIQGQHVQVEMGFGGVAAPYAVKVHEDPAAHHPVGEYKYLEKPFNKQRRHLPSDVWREINALI